jgi:hypothetical protein
MPRPLYDVGSSEGRGGGDKKACRRPHNKVQEACKRSFGWKSCVVPVPAANLYTPDHRFHNLCDSGAFKCMYAQN